MENHEVTSAGRNESKGGLRALVRAGLTTWGPGLLKIAGRMILRALWFTLTGDWPGDDWPFG